jgi:hypothetical protein
LEGANRLRKYLSDLAAARRWSEGQMRELVAIAGFGGEQKIPAERQLEALLERAEAGGEHLVASALWACLTQWHATHARLPSHRQWFVDRCLPALRQALTRVSAQPEVSLSNWLAALRRCPDDLRLELARFVEEVGPSVHPTVVPSLLNLFTEAPEFAPAGIVRQVLDSGEASLRDLVVLDMVAETEPGWLVARRQQDPEADRALSRRSLTDGTLFFPTGYYTPRDLRFHSYSSPSAAQPGGTPRPSDQAQERRR